MRRTTSIFSAEPTTPEFAELKLLITAIKTYEAQYVKFPELRLLDLINHRMAMFGLTPENLPTFFGTQENKDLFFAGKKQLTKGKLQKLFKMLSIKIPVSEFE
ncbi:hypothetical protein ABDD95_21090 [Mucilaginibacter sp. PAMB04274]|uniref:hypothetical protein n=1 Tax=Mucilaginibacter sp. PAMB04274 TaxID=3138568 RepID=UPI0031F6CDF6